ncbi:hypothetical protein GC175_28220 [bacterium]|nr:hypothetical protein [bacterium]
MPTINVLYWNLQDFGNDPQGYKGNYAPLCDFITAVTALAQADIICIQELKQPAINQGYLQLLHRALNSLGAPRNNWYYDWIKGAIRDDNDAFGNPLAVSPYATANDLAWDVAHHEGYALFWNQNIAKFMMQAAAPVAPTATPLILTPNTQSGWVRTIANNPAAGVFYGIAVPAGGISVPIMGGSYILPTGTMAPAGTAIMSGGMVVLAAGATSGGQIMLNPGDVIPAGTTIGAGGIELNDPVYAGFYGLNPVVVPGNFQLTDPLTLPAGGGLVVPQHSLSLVLTGRAVANNGNSVNFDPMGPNTWPYLDFTRSAAHVAAFAGPRRPAFCTIDVNRQNPVIGPAHGPADKLVPIIMYHAPSALAAATAGMSQASTSRPLYQAFDSNANTWINNTHAVLGGDFNAPLTPGVGAYADFTNPFGPTPGDGSGANCNTRVNHPAPAMPMGAMPRDNPLNKSTVQLRTSPVGGGVPINTINPNDYRRLAIDNVFYRGFAPAQAPAIPGNNELYDLLLAVTNAAVVGANIPPAFIFNFLSTGTLNNNLPAYNHAIGQGPPVPAPPATPGILNINASLTNMLLHGFFADPPLPGVVAWPAAFGMVPPPARRAAEFIRLCVSDHLPVIFQMIL